MYSAVPRSLGELTASHMMTRVANPSWQLLPWGRDQSLPGGSWAAKWGAASDGQFGHRKRKKDTGLLSSSLGCAENKHKTVIFPPAGPAEMFSSGAACVREEGRGRPGPAFRKDQCLHRIKTLRGSGPRHCVSRNMSRRGSLQGRSGGHSHKPTVGNRWRGPRVSVWQPRPGHPSLCSPLFPAAQVPAQGPEVSSERRWSLTVRARKPLLPSLPMELRSLQGQAEAGTPLFSCTPLRAR